MLNKLSHNNKNTYNNNNNNNDNELRFLPVPFTEAAPLVWFGSVRFWFGFGFGFVCLILFSLPMQQHVLNYFHHLGANKYKFATTPPVDNSNSNNNNDSKRLSLAKTAQAATATAPVEGCSCARLANSHFN